MRVALIGCGKQKASTTCQASMLYRSQLFQSSLRYAMDTCDQTFILSAKHGLLELDQAIEPYDETLPRDLASREAWGALVMKQLDLAVPDLDAELVVLAGERYADVLIPEDRDWNWEEPLRGLQIGERLAWLKRSRTRLEQPELWPHDLGGAVIQSSSWTIAEEALLRAHYAPGRATHAPEVPGRTATACYHRARRLGLLKARRWTRRDDDRLRMLWGDGGTLEEVARALDRSPKTTYWRAQHLELPLGVPQGFEYLTAAAKRTGYDVSTLRLVLRWAGVHIPVVLGRPTGARRRFHRIEPDVVDQAIADWHATEAVHPAAVARGLVGETLRRWLLDAGHAPPKRFRAHWRVPTATIDRVVAEHRVAPRRKRRARAGQRLLRLDTMVIAQLQHEAA